jgi:SAM-dependent methyltransferase
MTDAGSAPLRPPSAALYDALAPIYDEWQRANDATPFSDLVLSRLEPALARHGGGAGGGAGAPFAFLDIGCATGELLLGLRRHHPAWRLVGVDPSVAMLAVARAKAPGGAAALAAAPRGGERAIAWVEGALGRPIDLAAGALEGAAPFDAAGCFYDTLNHLPDRAALDAAAAAVAAALRPGGLFVFDVTNELGFRTWWHGDSLWRGEGWSVATRTSYDAPTGVARAAVVVTRGTAQLACELTERCFTEEAVRTALGAAGLSVVSTDRWSPFEIDAPGKTWVVCRKSDA